MNHINAKQVNAEGGLMVERADGIFFYCAPGDDTYLEVVAHFGDAIEPYVNIEPYVDEDELLVTQMRGQRDAMLAQLDAWISNPLRWAEYTAEQKAAFAIYRQALLDVPQQNGFPHEIDWPQLSGN